MAEAELNDHEPGVPLKVRHLAGGASGVLIPIRSEENAPARNYLMVRWDRNGEIFATLFEVPAKRHKRERP